MSTANSPTDPHADGPSSAADTVSAADLVRLVAAGTGDGVAAAGLLAAVCEHRDVAYQCSVEPLPDPAGRDTTADATVALGRPARRADVVLGTTRSASAAALAVAREFDTVGDRETILALAGTLAAGRPPGEGLLGAAETLDRRAGIALPTDRPEALARSTLLCGPFSGDPDRARELLAGTDSGRERASQVALSVAADEALTARGAERVTDLLCPYLGGPVGTVGGYGDVLDALARTDPGRALALALGDDIEVLPTWRETGGEIHATLADARTGRYDGLFVARYPDGAPVGAVARLLETYRSPEPATLAVAGKRCVLRSRDPSVDAGRAVETVAAELGGTGAGTPTRGRARIDAEPSEVVLTTREAV